MRAAAPAVLSVATLLVVAACSGSSAPAPSSGASRTPPPSATSPAPRRRRQPRRAVRHRRRPVPRPALFETGRQWRPYADSLSTSVRARRPARLRSGGELGRGGVRRLGYDVRRQRLRVPAGTPGACRCARARRGTWSPGHRASPATAAPGRRRPPRHRAAGAGSRGQRVRRGGRPRDLAAAAGARDPAAGRVRGLRRRGAARRDGIPHHFGSRAMVARMSGEERDMRGMVALDRVGVGSDACRSATANVTPTRRRAAAAERGAGAAWRPVARHQSVQRPLVVRDSGAPGRADRQHALRGLPQCR